MEHRGSVFRFADVVVCERDLSVVKAGEVLSVEPKAFKVLQFLLHNPGRVIRKDELLDAVWNDCEVSESSLTRCIAILRRQLGDDIRQPRYIATVPTVGYRFLCDVEVTENGSADLDEVGLRHPDIRYTVEPLKGTHGVQGNPGDLQVQSSFVKEEEERVGLPSNGGRRQLRKLLVPGLIAAALLTPVAAFLLYRAIGNHNAPGHAIPPANMAAASAKMRVVPLTSLPGLVEHPALSPDGEKISFVWNGENSMKKGDLYVQLVGGEKPLRLTHTSKGFICCPDWSPDGREIAFGRCDDNGGGVFIVPALGGPERKLTDVICTFGDGGYPKWTADGRSLVLADRCTPGGPRGIVLFSLTTAEKRCLHTLSRGDAGDMAPAVSPDQKTVAFLSTAAVGSPEIYTVPLSGGNARQLTPDGTSSWDPMWSSDGQYIIFNSARSGLSQVWRVPAAGGAIEPETVYPGTGALSRDGRRLAYVEPPGLFQGSRRQLHVDISRVELAGAGGQVVSQDKILASYGGVESLEPSPDGRQIIFASARSGREQIWRSDADGSDLMQMTFFDKGYAGTPRWSPDGKWIAFDYDPEAHRQIYLIDSEGRNLHMVTSGNYENVLPGWSRDGSGVYFASTRTGSFQVWRRELATGREAQVTHHGGVVALESYDATRLYYSRPEGGGIWSIPVSGGEEHQVTDALHGGGDFAVTETGIYLLNSEAAPKPTIMFYSFQTRLLTTVLQLEGDPVRFGIATVGASRDGRTVLFAEGVWHSSITMAQDFH